MYTYTRFLVVALLGACVADGDAPPIEADVHTAAIQHPDAPEAVGNEAQLQEPPIAGPRYEAMNLYFELRDRLDERGVTPEEMQAAVDAGDAERVRKLFGYTPEEFAEKNATVVALAELVHRSGPDESVVPEGAGCGWGVVDCGMGFLGWAWAFPGYAIGIFVGATVYCGLRNCHLKGTDPDPLAGPP